MLSNQTFSAKRRLTTAAATVLASASGVWAAPITSTTISVADAFVTNGPSNNLNNDNYGGAGALALSSVNASNGEFQSVLRFDLSSVVAGFNSAFTSGWTIRSVSLQFNAASPNNPIFNSPNATGSMSVKWMQNDSWTEGTGSPASPATAGITYSSLPSFLSGADETVGTPNQFPGGTSGTSGYSLSLMSGFKADLTSGGLVSFDLLAPATSGIAFFFNSHNFGTMSAQPVLSVTADVPEPTFGAVMSAAGAAFLLKRRRK